MNLDPRAIALGESFVANPNGVIAADNNPATLGRLKNLSVYFTKRNINWFEGTKDMFFYSIGALSNTPIGNFAFTYKRFNMGKIGTSTVSEPFGDGGTVELYDHTLIVSYANTILENLSIGVNLKTTRYVENMLIGQTDNIEYNTPIIADIGILYYIPNPLQNSVINDEIYFGAALENYGTDYKRTYKDKNLIVTIPRYIKLGYTYELGVKNIDNSNLFKLVFTGQYKSELNSYENSQKDYWGTGFEVSFFNLLSLRIGGSAQPYNSIFGEKGILTLRYGFGINFLLESYGINYPLALKFNYTVMPIYTSYLSSFWKAEKRNLDVFDFEVIYTNGIF
jgi:hypothetical protein